MSEAGNGQDDESGDEETDAGKEHLTTRHLWGNLKLGKSELNERISPSPQECSRKSKESSPNRALKNTVICHKKCGRKVTAF